MKVLIADDDPTSLAILRNVLEKTGYEVLTAANGRAALEIIQKGDSRLVISDWEMPEMTGPELCQAVRQSELPEYVYIILLTSHAGPEYLIPGLASGADDFIPKPFHPGELAVRVRVAERILSLETRDVAIFAVAKLAESRDPETGAHLERVRAYCRVLVEDLRGRAPLGAEVDADFARLIWLTSPLHDIGKVGVPDAVLLKPGRLSDEEFEVMKTHTLVGARTLEAALRAFPEARFLRLARDIAASHHERYDGTGYPAGLVGEQIPLCARVVALADVYDALTSRRVYKSACADLVARSIIHGESGRQFDPSIVEAFARHQAQFAQIRELLGDAKAAA